jgi:hypothetical protein
LGIPADFLKNERSAGNYFFEAKSAGKSLEIPADFPENLKYAGKDFLVQNPQENL